MPSFSFTLTSPDAAAPFAQLNGITLPVSVQGAQAESVYLEDEGRSFNGTARRVLRAVKREWKLDLVVQDQLSARAFAGLVNGLGHTWNFTATGLYASTGLAPVAGHTSTVVAGGVHPSTSLLRVPASTTISWLTALGAAPLWTVVAWRKESGVWHHYVYRQTGDGWYDGAYTPALINAEDFISFDGGGNLMLSGLTGLTDMYDVQLMPYLVPDSWGPQIYEQDVDFAKTGLPRLHAEGDLFYQVAGAVYVVGRVESANLVRSASARNAEQLNIKLSEV